MAVTAVAGFGAGVVIGGTTGQLLSKIDASDYNTTWVDAPSGGGATDLISLTDTPAGYGTAGQVLTSAGASAPAWGGLNGGTF